MTYYFYAYLHLPVSKETKPKGPVLFSVPSGNFGDALAGYFAKKLGLPIHRLIIATNSNNVLEVFLKTGWYRVQTVQPTLSPAMDISVASNFERALALWVHSPHQVQQYMDDLSKHGAFQVATKVWNHACQDLWSVSVTDQEILEAMHSAYSSYQYLLDPHTAVGWVALHQYPDFQKYPCVVLSTAHPGKFPSAVHQATHIPLSAIIPTTLSTLLKADRRRYHLKTVSLDGLINEVLSKNDWPISGIIKVGSTILKKLDSGLEE
ncbi:hypothetical protein HMI54_012784 [Coelomomyces lativittatus]|nr:hypothetical protein HMI54_012784 [Coelomomyces lativittatus]